MRLGSRWVRLTSRELILFSLLAENGGKILSHEQLLERMGATSLKANSRALRYYIRQLREKLEKDPSSPRLITTHRGLGYSFPLDTKVNKSG